MPPPLPPRLRLPQDWAFASCGGGRRVGLKNLSYLAREISWLLKNEQPNTSSLDHKSRAYKDASTLTSHSTNPSVTYLIVQSLLPHSTNQGVAYLIVQTYLLRQEFKSPSYCGPIFGQKCLVPSRLRRSRRGNFANQIWLTQLTQKGHR